MEKSFGLLKYFARLVTITLLVTSLFSQSVLASTIAHPAANSFDIRGWSETARNLQPRFNTTNIRARLQAHLSNPNSTKFGDASRVLILLIALSGLEVVRREVNNAQLSGQTLSPEEYARLAGEASLKVADDGALWMGIMGDVATTTAMQRPAQALDVILKNRVAKPLIQNLIKSGIMSLATFVGFQACAQLWREARLLLDPRDHERAERIWSLGFSGIIGLVRGDQQNEDARVAKQLFTNMTRILIVDHELRENWFYNTWRLAIATGRFVTLVSGVATAVAVGTTIYPGAGSVAGFIFALIGATASQALPKSVNDGITDRFRGARVTYTQVQLAEWHYRLRNSIAEAHSRNVLWNVYKFFVGGRRSGDLSSNLEFMRTLRERVSTAYLERLYAINSRLQKLVHDFGIARANPNGAEQKRDLLEQIRAQRTRRAQTIQTLLEFYESEYHVIEGIQTPREVSPDVIQKLNSAKAEIAAIHSFIKTFGEAFRYRQTFASAEVVLQNFYLRSFKETEVTRLVGQQTLNRH